MPPFYFLVFLGTYGSANDDQFEDNVLCIAYDDIKEVSKCRFQLQEVGLEFFQVSGHNFLLAFDTRQERDQIYSKVQKELESRRAIGKDMKSVASRASNLRKNVLLDTIRLRWQQGNLSNFDYLILLNTLAGRSYNDLTQYPVFPWILSDYESESLDLSSPVIYRDLSKPMGAIDPARAETYRERFECWEDPVNNVPKFHYGTHYSSAAGTLYYLFRLEPFSTMALNFQGGKFDHADRLFYDIGHSWRSASSAGGMSDVKEIVPEFFYLPDFLCNNSRFDIGEFQNGTWLDSVKLPRWAKGDPRRFIKLHKMALESEHVSANLHNWIDLIFGYKQFGPRAEEALNVFYHLTYEGSIDISKITDPFEREVVISQINNFGQTPHQLFKDKPHPKRDVLRPPPIISTHCQLLKPTVKGEKKHGKLNGPVMSLTENAENGKLVALEKNKAFFPKKYSKYLHWGYSDQSLRFSTSASTPRHSTNEVVAVHEGLHDDQITAVHVTVDGNYIITGGQDAVVSIVKISKVHKYKWLTPLRSLCLHSAPITLIISSIDWSIFVSACEDRRIAFWDMNRLLLSRFLPELPAPITSLAIDDSNGNVATCCGVSLFIWSINGDLIAQNRIAFGVDSEAISVTFSKGPNYIDNLILTGHKDGKIKFWELTLEDFDTIEQKSAHSIRQKVARRSAFPDASISNKVNETSVSEENFLLGSRSKGNETSVDNLLLGPKDGKPYMVLGLKYELAASNCSITSLYCSLEDLTTMYCGDAEGNILSFTLATDSENWIEDSLTNNCQSCNALFTLIIRKHHCRVCGRVVCATCSAHRVSSIEMGFPTPVRMCDSCCREVVTLNTV
jgi:WD40 repeat protein